MPATLTPEEQAKVEAWVLAIRQLARQYRCAHRSDIGFAIKSARRLLATETLDRAIQQSLAYGVTSGIPEEELRTIRALLFG